MFLRSPYSHQPETVVAPVALTKCGRTVFLRGTGAAGISVPSAHTQHTAGGLEKKFSSDLGKGRVVAPGVCIMFASP